MEGVQGSDGPEVNSLVREGEESVSLSVASDAQWRVCLLCVDALDHITFFDVPATKRTIHRG